MPTRLLRQDAGERRVGVEIEMSGIDLEVIAAQLQSVYGGHIEATSEYEYKVIRTELGDFRVDLDSEYLQKIGRENPRGDGIDFERLAADAVQALMKNVIPCELVAPPLSFARLPELDAGVERLRRSGAKGTRYSLLSAFGVHLNPELPDLTAETIIAYLRAFVCLRSWLEAREDVGLSRKLSPFIRTYPEAYVDRLLRDDYAPSLGDLISDYLEENPTRNRMLDMLPLFAFLDEAPVVAAVGGQKLRKRPTLHCRLPNSDIDNPEWGIWRSWNDWTEVEALAGDGDRLGEVCRAYRSSRDSGYFSLDYYSWKDDVQQWLSDPS
jgi:hypothetical protein